MIIIAVYLGWKKLPEAITPRPFGNIPNKESVITIPLASYSISFSPHGTVFSATSAQGHPLTLGWSLPQSLET